MQRRIPVLAVAIACAALLASAPSASAHAQLVGTSPVSGATVPHEPAEVIFKFNQNVGGTLGAVRVYDASGNEVDNLDVSHPYGQEHWMGVGLKPGLPDGTYTATYRVISADTHIVYGGVVFSIGVAGPAPKFTVAGLIERGKTGRVTVIAFGVVRALDYLTIALMVGGLALLLAAALPALAVTDSAAGAASALNARALRILSLNAAAGALVSVLGILLQGASAAGVSLWGSLKSTVIENTLESRFGEVWGVRALDWLAIAALLAIARASVRRSPERTAWPTPIVAVLGAGCLYLVATPALAGHASIQSPTAVFLPSDVLHVLSASLWVGGILFLLIAMPAATRRLGPAERSRALTLTLERFSPLALAAVAVIAVTGVIQAYIDVRSFSALLESTYGNLVLAKTAGLLVLIALGATQRRRVIPALRAAVAAASSPGGAGVLARRVLRAEFAVMVAVLGLTAALISYAPPIDAATGPVSVNTRLGPAELEMTVEPARVGLNTIHMYLIDAASGTQFSASKELLVAARLPSKGIGPLPLRVSLAGPGHYIVTGAVLSPGGTWQIQITDRISEFEEFSRTIAVPVR